MREDNTKKQTDKINDKKIRMDFLKKNLGWITNSIHVKERFIY